MLNFIKWFFNNKLRVVILLILILGGGYYGYQQYSTSNTPPVYQTATVEKGTLTTSVTASGTVSQTTGATITTQATGIVAKVYVKDGDIVTAGQKIADITLDTASAQKQSAAWSSYLSAKSSLESANSNLHSLQSQLFAANQEFINDAVERELESSDPTYIQQNADWKAAEADYKNQQNVIAAAHASLNASWLSYSQLQPTIIAPMSGRISGLSLVQGMTIASSTSTTSTPASISLGTITLEGGLPQVTVNLTEIDVVKVKSGQKVILTVDALPDLGFTGVVKAINTNGSTTSNVTTYPATIAFDSAVDTIYPNMAVNATIITDIQNDVILVPLSSIQTNNDLSTVRVIKDGQVSSVQVETGKSNDTQTEIVSGINEGETIVIGQTTGVGSSVQGTTTSPFGGTSRGLGGAGGFVRTGGNVGR